MNANPTSVRLRTPLTSAAWRTLWDAGWHAQGVWCWRRLLRN